MKKVRAILELIIRVLSSILNPGRRARQSSVSKPVYGSGSGHSRPDRPTGNSGERHRSSTLALQAPYYPINLLGWALMITGMVEYFR